MIPPFVSGTGALPPGIHESDWAEVVTRFGFSPERQLLLAGLREALKALVHAGCTRVYLGGSFVTAKVDPGDWDGAFERAGVTGYRLGKSIATGDAKRMKMVFSGEVYDADAILDSGVPFRSFFQHDRDGNAVGVVALDPTSAL